MSHRNARLIDAPTGRFRILNLVEIEIPGPWLWRCEDIDEQDAKGVTFLGYPDLSEKPHVASITVVDVSTDPTEPDISTMDASGVSLLDERLEREVSQHWRDQGGRLVAWMGSHLNIQRTPPALLTAYTVGDHEKERQFIAMRILAGSRKVVMVGSFDVKEAALLARSIFSVLNGVSVLPTAFQTAL